ncbi:hypothetical protein CCOS865_00769 [Pseudomonas reidholzensis]|uniref:Zeta toxin domain-containing protein n=1 Tax=Pseudomonas reidholzensis TaxID=1785162 RepID=A0A383RNC0_9PSED|nr:zeta toxin family protein [Pseudomonas reidholzensis]SYX88540.1 hypothetical protein CCOS865_00769 [Pseudomonas reidholzensis]
MSDQYPYTADDVDRAYAQLETELFNKTRDHDPDDYQLPSPTVLFVAGAQGSGKTYLLEKKLLPSGRYENYVRLYLPEFRELHPHYAQMSEHGVLHVYEHTEAFIKALSGKVYTYAFANRYNIIMECALDDPQFAGFPPAAALDGYRFEVHLIACQKEFSHWGTLDRVVKSIARDELERVVSLAQIEAVLGNAMAILVALEKACTEKVGSAITLYLRGLDTDKQSKALCHSRCDVYGTLTPQADYDGQAFFQTGYPGGAFQLVGHTLSNGTYTQYARVVHAELTDDALRQKMVQACSATLEKASLLGARVPEEVFEALKAYQEKYQ